MVEHRWRSDIPSRDCIQIAIFGYGERYTLSESETPGRCQTTVPSNLAALDAGQPFLARGTRYGDAKFDKPKVPSQVAASQARWQGFDRWLRDVRRSFTGVVTSVGGNRIHVRSPSSGNQQEFRIDPARIDSPVALDTLLNKSVRVDYRGTGYKSQAVRIRLTPPPTKPSAVRAITGLGSREAKAAVESAPDTIQSGVSEKDAEGIAAELERAGARVAIQSTRSHELVRSGDELV